MLTHAAFLKQIQPAVEEMQAVGKKSKSSSPTDYNAILHCYSRLDNAFVPNGQYDLDVQAELRELIKQPLIKVVISPLVEGVERLTSLQHQDLSHASWRLLNFLGGVSATADLVALDATPAYALRLAAYCVAVVHGTPWAALPALPLSPEVERLPAELRHPRIPLLHVPGRRSRGPYGDNGQVVSGAADETNDPTGSGWGV